MTALLLQHALSGELTIFRLQELEASLQRVHAGDTLDLSAVHVLDAAAIGAFVRLAKRTGVKQVTLRGTHGVVRRVLDLARINELFVFED